MSNTQKLTAIISPSNADNTLSWRSDNDSIATVDNEGNVVGLSAGSTKISATTINNLVAECDVVVGQNPREITLSNSTINLIAGNTQQLTISYIPIDTTEKNIIWSSSDETIAIVDSLGLVTALDVGDCIITATSSNDLTDICECKISVEPTSIRFLEATYDNDSAIITTQDKIEILPVNADQKYYIDIDKMVNASGAPQITSGIYVDSNGVLYSNTNNINVFSYDLYATTTNNIRSTKTTFSASDMQHPFRYYKLDYDEIELQYPSALISTVFIPNANRSNIYLNNLTSDIFRFSSNINITPEFYLNVYTTISKEFGFILFGNNEAVDGERRYIVYEADTSTLKFIEGAKEYSHQFYEGMPTVGTSTLVNANIKLKYTDNKMYLKITTNNSTDDSIPDEWQEFDLPAEFNLSYSNMFCSFNSSEKAIYNELYPTKFSQTPNTNISIYSLEISRDINNKSYARSISNTIPVNTSYDTLLLNVGSSLDIEDNVIISPPDGEYNITSTASTISSIANGSRITGKAVGGAYLSLSEASNQIDSPVGVSSLYMYHSDPNYKAPSFGTGGTVTNYTRTANSSGHLCIGGYMPYSFLPRLSTAPDMTAASGLAASQPRLTYVFTPYAGSTFVLLGYDSAAYSNSAGCSYILVTMSGGVTIRYYYSTKSQYNTITHTFPSLTYGKSYTFYIWRGREQHTFDIYLSSGSVQNKTPTTNTTNAAYSLPILKTSKWIGEYSSSYALSSNNRCSRNSGTYFKITSISLTNYTH